MKVVVAIHSK